MNILFSTVFLFLQFSVPNYSVVHFQAPLHIPLHLSGNFGELRSNHFHTGIDVKTNGKIGYRVYSIDDGYVSRIKVSTSGYGNALYVTHNNGFMSVYGHLHRFNIQIEDYLRSIQYKKHSFTVDIHPKKDFIKVKKGEVIAISGNSGGSMGPHLHFEVRETSTEMSVNPLLFNFPIKDNISPLFRSLYVYSLDNVYKKYKILKNGSIYSLKNDTINVPDSLYFGVRVNDYLNGSRNSCGVYSLKLFVNNKLKYEFLVDKLSFFEQRNVLSHMDYGLSRKRIRIHRCFVDPNNTSSTNKVAIKGGKIFINTDSVKFVSIVATDVYNNTSVLKFFIKGNKFSSKEVNNINLIQWDKDTTIDKDGVKLYFRKNTLFNDEKFNFVKSKSSKFDGYTYSIGSADIPVKKYYKIQIPLQQNSLKYFNKMYVAKIEENEFYCVSSKVFVRNGVANFRLREFGKFVILEDTISPEVKFVNIKNGTLFNKKRDILIKIKDNQTGIKKYNCLVDGKWLLFEYNKKRDLLKYSFDDHFPKGVNHTLSVVVADKVGNISKKSVSFSVK